MGAASSQAKIEDAKNAVLVLIRRDTKQVLLTREKMGPDQKKWGLPGGKIERGYNARQTFAKEAKEEVLIDYTMWRNNKDVGVDYVMCGTTAYFIRELRPNLLQGRSIIYPIRGKKGLLYDDQEIDGVHWTKLSDLLATPYKLQDVLSYKTRDGSVSVRENKGLRNCFVRCLSDPDVRRVLTDVYNSL
tara:strand:- start:15 stop:578 length:564 start_codon:yes stop_codon:yes gene_type:complete